MASMRIGGSGAKDRPLDPIGTGWSQARGEPPIITMTLAEEIRTLGGGERVKVSMTLAEAKDLATRLLAHCERDPECGCPIKDGKTEHRVGCLYRPREGE